MTSTRLKIPRPREKSSSSEAWEWQLSARCRDEDQSMFFHPDGERGRARRSRQQHAKAICAECPVRMACWEHSVQFEERFGTWGGVSEEERIKFLDAARGASHTASGARHSTDNRALAATQSTVSAPVEK